MCRSTRDWWASPNNKHSYLYILKYPDGKFKEMKLPNQRVCTAVHFLCMLLNYLLETFLCRFAFSVVLCNMAIASPLPAQNDFAHLILRLMLVFSAFRRLCLICINRKGIVAEPFPDWCQAENRSLAPGWVGTEMLRKATTWPLSGCSRSSLFLFMRPRPLYSPLI